MWFDFDFEPSLISKSNMEGIFFGSFRIYLNVIYTLFIVIFLIPLFRCVQATASSYTTGSSIGPLAIDYCLVLRAIHGSINTHVSFSFHVIAFMIMLLGTLGKMNHNL